jgi:elongation factor G
MKERLIANPLLLQLPVGQGENFTDVIDLIEMKQISWDEETLGVNYHLGDIGDEYLMQAEKYREKIIEAAAEYDDEVMEAYLSEMPIDPQKILDAIRRATINLELIPVLCGSALKNKGIQPLLDAIAKFLPSPVASHKRDASANRRYNRVQSQGVRSAGCSDIQSVHDRGT